MKQRDKVDTGTQWSDQTDTSCHYYGDGHSQHFLKPGLELKLSMLATSYWWTSPSRSTGRSRTLAWSAQWRQCSHWTSGWNKTSWRSWWRLTQRWRKWWETSLRNKENFIGSQKPWNTKWWLSCTNTNNKIVDNKQHSRYTGKIQFLLYIYSCSWLY